MSTDYLCIEPFLRDAVPGRILELAYSCGLIDALAEAVPPAESSLPAPGDAAGRAFMLQNLQAAGVIERCGATGKLGLTAAFRGTRPYQELAQTRLKFARMLLPDFMNYLPQLLQGFAAFRERAGLFELFDYSRCLTVSPQNCLHASRWMELTTVLTKFEAPCAVDAFDFSGCRSLLDVGGNSGEFARCVCKRFPAIHATVADLPVVCEVGRRHLAESSQASRVSFLPLNAVEQPLPRGFDLVSFKSMLHDWPPDHAAALLDNAFQALEPGGRILIFERAKHDFSADGFSYGQIPVLLFFRSYRSPQAYADMLAAVGFADIELQTMALDSQFVLITARKPM